MADEDDFAPIDVMRAARDELAELTGMHAETVSRMEQAPEGWVLDVEMLELSRVPDTMSLLSTYEVTLDGKGRLTGYRRLRRYERGRADPARGPGGST